MHCLQCQSHFLCRQPNERARNRHGTTAKQGCQWTGILLIRRPGPGVCHCPGHLPVTSSAAPGEGVFAGGGRSLNIYGPGPMFTVHLQLYPGRVLPCPGHEKVFAINQAKERGRLGKSRNGFATRTGPGTPYVRVPRHLLHGGARAPPEGEGHVTADLVSHALPFWTRPRRDRSSRRVLETALCRGGFGLSLDGCRVLFRDATSSRAGDSARRRGGGSVRRRGRTYPEIGRAHV